MQVSASEAFTVTDGHQYEAGSLASYTARTDGAKKMRQTKTFGCRHCRHRPFKPKRAHRVKNTDANMERLFTFDGLVSHAKEKCVFDSLSLP